MYCTKDIDRDTRLISRSANFLVSPHSSAAPSHSPFLLACICCHWMVHFSLFLLYQCLLIAVCFDLCLCQRSPSTLLFFHASAPLFGLWRSFFITLVSLLCFIYGRFSAWERRRGRCSLPTNNH